MVIADLGDYWSEKKNKSSYYKEAIINAILRQEKQS